MSVPLVRIAADPPTDPALMERAAALAEQLQLPLADTTHACGCEDVTSLLLALTADHLEARVQSGPEGIKQGKPIYADLTTIDTRSGPGRSLKQPILKAIGLKKGDAFRPSVLDGTAGYAEDAWLLASFGCRVRAIEANPVVWALASDARERAATRGDAENAATAERLRLEHADTIDVLATLAEAEQPDVVYLDPMFPTGRKTAEKKPMKLIRALVGDAEPHRDEALLRLALQVAKRRVVVKRPTHAPPLAGREAAVAHAGKGIRFDVYPTR